MRRTVLFALAAPFALAACGQGKAPSDKIKDATEQLVQDASDTAPPTLADGPYAPRDECTEIPGASAFREQLAQAVAARDADALVSLAASDVKLDFGGGSGAGELRSRLSKDEWSLWDELDTLLAMGCAKNKQGGITLPWYFAQEIDAVDPAMGMMVTGEKIPLRNGPGSDAEKLQDISWDVIELVDGLHPEDAYQHVETVKGKQGYIATDKLRSLLDYRLIASSRDGKWSITSLVAGD